MTKLTETLEKFTFARLSVKHNPESSTYSVRVVPISDTIYWDKNIHTVETHLNGIEDLMFGLELFGVVMPNYVREFLISHIHLIEQAISNDTYTRRLGLPVYLYLDLDHLREINDTVPKDEVEGIFKGSPQLLSI